jgi:hypothetical protein
MRLLIAAFAALSFATPAAALAQCVNPSGMTLPNFQASYLLAPAPAAPAAPPQIVSAPPAKLQTVAATSAPDDRAAQTQSK